MFSNKVNNNYCSNNNKESKKVIVDIQNHKILIELKTVPV